MLWIHRSPRHGSREFRGWFRRHLMWHLRQILTRSVTCLLFLCFRVKIRGWEVFKHNSDWYHCQCLSSFNLKSVSYHSYHLIKETLKQRWLTMKPDCILPVRLRLNNLHFVWIKSLSLRKYVHTKNTESRRIDRRSKKSTGRVYLFVWLTIHLLEWFAFQISSRSLGFSSVEIMIHLFGCVLGSTQGQKTMIIWDNLNFNLSNSSMSIDNTKLSSSRSQRSERPPSVKS